MREHLASACLPARLALGDRLMLHHDVRRRRGERSAVVSARANFF
jgi:hypothetical protein